MKKQLINSLALSLVLSFCFALTISANTEITDSKEINSVSQNYEIYIYGNDVSEDIVDSALRYTLISQLGIGLTISNQTAYIYTECQTYDKATISLTTELQQYNGSWNTIKKYDVSKSNTKLWYCDETYSVTRNYQYRIKLTATVTVGSHSETDTRYGTEQTAYFYEIDNYQNELFRP